jgi:prenylcysteine alpha-carboxyl methylesterase
MGWRLLIFTFLILPAVLQAAFFWLFHPSVIKGIRFGPNPRNFLDIYVPPSATSGEKKSQIPVVVNVMGGAWIIGYRAWSAWMGKRLALEQGFIFVAVDYRNFPQAQMSDMVDDVALALDWIFRHIENYGDDPHNVTLLGQSAGAQLSGLVLLERCLAEAANSEITDRWSVRDIRRFVGISGPYNLKKISSHLAKRGLNPEILRYICDGEVEVYSPELRVCDPDWLENLQAQKLMPPISLIHGTADKTVPKEQSVDFAEKLKAGGIGSVDLILLDGVTHSEPIVEGPIRGADHLMEVLMPLLGVFDYQDKIETKPLQPQLMTRIASVVMPF